MSKLSKFQRSQRAHIYLSDKAGKIFTLNGAIKRMYHSEVEFEQRQKVQVLPKKERKNIYKKVESFYKKGVKEGKSIKKLNLDYMLKHYNPFD